MSYKNMSNLIHFFSPLLLLSTSTTSTNSFQPLRSDIILYKLPSSFQPLHHLLGSFRILDIPIDWNNVYISNLFQTNLYISDLF
ncbi:hypothetical protein GIB67_008483 [Kingdonia uniflora]|uniref:Uncharacterized protein n=1 Tax=Kingdonia uniflora TaxID=39325 RepID=A0A7J7N5N8_9MAGN|nr:hypothetical protein GIB67_008483 [Kingdonia uniflora]